MSIFLCLVFTLSTLIKFLYIWGNNFAFTPDQGRDLVDIRQMVVTHIPRLVGPTTSVNGVLLGPFYYYFVSVPFILSGGSPIAIVIWQILWFQFSAIFIWYILSKKSLVLANITAILLLISPIGFSTARYFWNANVMPIFTVIFFACLLDTLGSKSSPRLLILGLVSGISLQIEAAFGLLFFPFALIVLLYKGFSSRDLLKFSLAFGVTILPQIFFEFRHGFLMTKTLFAGLSGASADLGEKLTFPARLLERRDIFFTSMRDSNHIGFEILGPILLITSIIATFYLVRRGKPKQANTLISVSSAFLILSACFYLIFPQHIKSWYVLGLPIPIILVLSGVLSNLYDENKFGQLICWFFLLFSTYYTLLAHSRYLFQYALLSSPDPSNMATELSVVDWVYKEAGGRSFKVYSYLPSVYDYTYQYLFWWHGTKEFGYQPADISYLPNQPEYIKNNDIYWLKKKETVVDNFTFLIIQKDLTHPDRQTKWKSTFTALCLLKTKEISNRLSIEVLTSCAK